MLLLVGACAVRLWLTTPLEQQNPISVSGRHIAQTSYDDVIDDTFFAIPRNVFTLLEDVDRFQVEIAYRKYIPTEPHFISDKDRKLFYEHEDNRKYMVQPSPRELIGKVCKQQFYDDQR